MAQLGLTRTQLSCREYFNVLSLLFKSPILQRLLEALGELEVTVLVMRPALPPAIRTKVLLRPL